MLEAKLVILKPLELGRAAESGKKCGQNITGGQKSWKVLKLAHITADGRLTLQIWTKDKHNKAGRVRPEGREPAYPDKGIGARCLLRRHHAGGLFVGCILWCDSARVVAAAREDKSPPTSRRGTLAVQDLPAARPSQPVDSRQGNLGKTAVKEWLLRDISFAFETDASREVLTQAAFCMEETGSATCGGVGWTEWTKAVPGAAS
ncbi:hypothetical protein MGYG_00699 [Nannizzia gypsea CBS 118893]|uniref:Uncharacterized protein n=1 Tax=Arthroderma gypseum (strain ATCC MYA-4604 / CBS 118893) TaxID=535722 RepID=E5R1A8_ARTGP|nr:hypothetical protein MGYG_00699 [Nannizzia gypsea CBS 118893]EFQ97659.1 hypothetical protein MGYG_00699 [Nannizzia gypsea CBS 118893]